MPEEKYKVKAKKHLSLGKILEDAEYNHKVMHLEVFESLKRDVEDEVEVEFFTLGAYITTDKIIEEYRKRGLRPASMEHLLLLNNENPSLLEKYPWQATVWFDDKNVEDRNKGWVYGTVSLFNNEKTIEVRRDERHWGFNWYYAGVKEN